MSTRKTILVAGIITAMSIGSVSIAEASSHTIHFAASGKSSMSHVDPVATVLAALVKAGTITQAQSDAITAALVAAHPDKPSISGGKGNGDMDFPGMGKGFNIKTDLAVITSTLGITTAQLQTDFAAGQSLATIAGDKTAALITALVAAETTKINAKVTAGEITQVQATALIAGLTTAVTAAVNASPMGHHGHHGHHGVGGGAVTPSATPTPSVTPTPTATH